MSADYPHDSPGPEKTLEELIEETARRELRAELFRGAVNAAKGRIRVRLNTLPTVEALKALQEGG